MIKEINSKDNRILKECQRLTQKKYRDKESRYLIEGHNLIEEAINDRVPIDYLIFDEEKALNTNFDGDSYIVKHSLFERIAQTETSQGVIAVVRKREYGFEELTARCQGAATSLSWTDCKTRATSAPSSGRLRVQDMQLFSLSKAPRTFFFTEDHPGSGRISL